MIFSVPIAYQIGMILHKMNVTLKLSERKSDIHLQIVGIYQMKDILKTISNVINIHKKQQRPKY